MAGLESRIEERIDKYLRVSNRVLLYSLDAHAFQVEQADKMLVAAIEAAVKARTRRLFRASVEAAVRKAEAGLKEAEGMLEDAYSASAARLVDILQGFARKLAVIISRLEQVAGRLHAMAASKDREGIALMRDGRVREAQKVAAHKVAIMKQASGLEERIAKLRSLQFKVEQLVVKLTKELPIYIQLAREMEALRGYEHEQLLEQIRTVKAWVGDVTGKIDELTTAIDEVVNIPDDMVEDENVKNILSDWAEIIRREAETFRAELEKLGEKVEERE